MTSSRLRVLFLTQRLPYAPNRGDRVRAFHELQILSGAADVVVASLVHDAFEAAQRHSLDGVAVETMVAAVPRTRNLIRSAAALATNRPLTATMLDSPALVPQLQRSIAAHRPDVVLAFCSSMARFALAPPLDGIPLVVDMVDADSAKWADLARHARWPMRAVYRRESRLLARLEAAVMRRAYATIAVNEREVNLLKALALDARVEAVENGVDLESFAPPSGPAASSAVVFSGVMNYEPNEMAAVWFASQVWPLVRRERPDAEFRIVGATPGARVKRLHNPAQGIVVTGSVPEVRTELWRAALAVAPLRVARGVQNKVLEGVAAGLPCVVTSQVLSGLPAEVLPACVQADEPEGYAKAVIAQLSKTPAERRIMAGVNLSGLSWQRRMTGLAPLLEEARAHGARRL